MEWNLFRNSLLNFDKSLKPEIKWIATFFEFWNSSRFFNWKVVCLNSGNNIKNWSIYVILVDLNSDRINVLLQCLKIQNLRYIVLNTNNILLKNI